MKRSRDVMARLRWTRAPVFVRQIQCSMKSSSPLNAIFPPAFHKVAVRNFAFNFGDAIHWQNEICMDDETIENKEARLNRFIKNQSHKLNVDAFGDILKALALCRQPSAPHRAEDYLFKLKGLGMVPTTDLYTYIIESWAHSHETTAIVRAERWFNTMKQNDQLTTRACNAFMNVCSKGLARKEAHLIEHAQKAEDILHFMLNIAKKEGSTILPNTETFNYALRAWTRCRKSQHIVEKTMKILQEMELLSKNHDAIQPNIISYGLAMDALSSTAAQKAGQLNKQNVRNTNFNPLDSTMNGLDELSKMEELLEYIHKLHDNGVPNVAPNTVVYNMLLSAWARVSINPNLDAPYQAEEVLRRMISLRNNKYANVAPDHHSYTRVIMAWANTKRANSGQRAEFFLKRLWEDYKASNDETLRPKISTYNAVLKAWGDDSVGMETLLIEMVRNEDNKDFPKPNSESFSTVIHCLLATERAQLCHPGEGITRAMGWLEEVLRREKQGTDVSTSPELFDGILKAAASCPSLDTLRISIDVLHKYKTSRHRMDSMAYVFILKSGLKTLRHQENDNDRTEFIHDIINNCKDDGLLTRKFVRELVNGGIYHTGWTGEESKRIVRNNFQEFPIPGSWTRNVQEEHAPNEFHFTRTNWEVIGE